MVLLSFRRIAVPLRKVNSDGLEGALEAAPAGDPNGSYGVRSHIVGAGLGSPALAPGLSFKRSRLSTGT